MATYKTSDFKKGLKVQIDGEPYLMQQGFVQRTPRGRMLASAAYGHLGLSAPATPQQSGLFPSDEG